MISRQSVEFSIVNGNGAFVASMGSWDGKNFRYCM